ncbi:hypothetical protein BO221_40720 [Archangium sp. Cb G35]|uniref:hypothetical protein n=1 Tax=Archangium sp. Cb G35 TaxID=1920190 RepID=UPI0009360602|nr:hypothetical protein [Archangium sp. Cb G35]OJT18396.1 hypothetical protein BO221_40720 [Archangium sp. Cb G35]
MQEQFDEAVFVLAVRLQGRWPPRLWFIEKGIAGLPGIGVGTGTASFIQASKPMQLVPFGLIMLEQLALGCLQGRDVVPENKITAENILRSNATTAPEELRSPLARCAQPE